MENKEEEKKKWGLYVLRYNYSGNYYVGDTDNLEKRMLIHLKQTSKLPKASWANHSTMGFKSYWFTIDNNNVSQSEAGLLENAFTREIDKMIEKIEGHERDREIYASGGDLAKNPYPKINPVEKDSLENDERHKKIDMYLKKISGHKLKIKYGEYSISLLEIGTVGEYHHKDCNKGWYELASIEFSVDNKRK